MFKRLKAYLWQDPFDPKQEQIPDTNISYEGTDGNGLAGIPREVQEQMERIGIGQLDRYIEKEAKKKDPPSKADFEAERRDPRLNTKK